MPMINNSEKKNQSIKCSRKCCQIMQTVCEEKKIKLQIIRKECMHV